MLAGDSSPAGLTKPARSTGRNQTKDNQPRGVNLNDKNPILWLQGAGVLVAHSAIE